MTKPKIGIIYIHGFNSSPASEKAQALVRYCRERGLADRVMAPQVASMPALALKQLETLIQRAIHPVGLLIGSSLGGYYASYLSEKYDIKTVLLNPAVAPHKSPVKRFLGRQTNPYTGETYDVTPEYMNVLAGLEIDQIKKPENFLLMVQTGDEILDYRQAVSKYAGARQIIQQGGDHSFEGFEDMLPTIARFAGLLS
ncbi:MAG: YqiA/YcfP family alpha/beta fold hydrolase [Pseudomonadales bacterium]|nr:YqiA/YcfP family alpha/beta fold hydrolase [Pseudomonadales bacterium]